MSVLAAHLSSESAASCGSRATAYFAPGNSQFLLRDQHPPNSFQQSWINKLELHFRLKELQLIFTVKLHFFPLLLPASANSSSPPALSQENNKSLH